MSENIETQVASTVLQDEIPVSIGFKKYNIAPPRTATVIMVSEAVSRIPEFDPQDKDATLHFLSIAKDCAPVGEIAAIILLGPKKARRKRWRFWGRTNREVLSEKLLEELSPEKLHDLVSEGLKKMQISDFFQLTASLNEINLLRRTKEAVMTASGQQSPESSKSTE